MRILIVWLCGIGDIVLLSRAVKKIIECFHGKEANWLDYVDLGHKRKGQDVRYALNDDKLRSLGWKPQKTFNEEIPKLVQFYKNNFRW